MAKTRIWTGAIDNDLEKDENWMVVTSGILPCGHPAACLGDESQEGEQVCHWCEEVASLRGQVESLRQQIGKTALIVTGGTVHLTCPEIGLLEMRGGSFYVENGRYERSI